MTGTSSTSDREGVPRAPGRRLAFALLRFSGLPLLVRTLVQRRRVTIVLLHDPEPETFARQLDALRSRYSLISLQDYVRWRRDGARAELPVRPLIVTFDDGHRRNAELARAFRSTGAPATIFICSGLIGTRRRFWFEHGLDRDEVEGLKHVPDEKRLEALAAHGYTDETEFDERQALSLEELRDLEQLLDLQAHTITHPILPNCSEDKLAEEVRGCKTALEGLGLSINAFAFPNGDYTDREVAAVEQAGYACALTVDAGYNTRETDVFRLKRIGVADAASPTEMIVKASGIVDVVKLAVRRPAAKG